MGSTVKITSHPIYWAAVVSKTLIMFIKHIYGTFNIWLDEWFYLMFYTDVVTNSHSYKCRRK